MEQRRVQMEQQATSGRRAQAARAKPARKATHPPVSHSLPPGYVAPEGDWNGPGQLHPAGGPPPDQYAQMAETAAAEALAAAVAEAAEDVLGDSGEVRRAHLTPISPRPPFTSPPSPRGSLSSRRVFPG